MALKTIEELPLEYLQALWGEFARSRDPREIGETIRALESGDLRGYSPSVQDFEFIYRTLVKKYDRVYSRWRSR